MQDAAKIFIVAILASHCRRDVEPVSNTDTRETVPAAHQPAAIPETPNQIAPRTPTTAVVFSTSAGKHQVAVEVVSTPAAIQRGLMHRQHLPPNSGMLFVFSSERIRRFWMKNTLIPLDMLFIRADFTIAGIEHNAEPLTLESRGVEIPTMYVLEVNSGWTTVNRIEVGASVHFENLPTITNAPL